MSLSIDSSSQVLENGYEHAELLSGNNDEHEGVMVNMEKPMDSKVFLTALRASISLWRKQVGVHFNQFPSELVDLISDNCSC